MADNLHLPIKTTKKCTSSTHLRAFFISYHQVSFCCISKVIIVPLLTWPVWTAHVQMHDAGLRLLSSGSRTVHQDTFWQSGSAFLSIPIISGTYWHQAGGSQGCQTSHYGQVGPAQPPCLNPCLPFQMSWGGKKKTCLPSFAHIPDSNLWLFNSTIHLNLSTTSATLFKVIPHWLESHF